MKLRLVCDMFLPSYLEEINCPDLVTWGIPSPGVDGFKSDLARQLRLSGLAGALLHCPELARRPGLPVEPAASSALLTKGIV